MSIYKTAFGMFAFSDPKPRGSAEYPDNCYRKRLPRRLAPEAREEGNYKKEGLYSVWEAKRN